MSAIFVFGTLCHLPLLRLVLAAEPDVQAAELPDHAVRHDLTTGSAVLRPQPGASVSGLLILNLGAEARARLQWYAAAFGAEPSLLETASGQIDAIACLPVKGSGEVGGGWSFDRWLETDAALATALADDMMALFPGPVPPLRLGARQVRGASRLRAEMQSTPTTLRRDVAPSDMQVATRREPYANFFAVEEYDMTWRRFDGSFGPVVTRAAFISGDAVTVLPYDPVRDRVLLIEQFRAGPFARGDRHPWSLEAIAGRIDPGESPETAARREAEEEAGLQLTELLPVGSYYPTPGAKTEYLYSYVALTDLPDGCAIVGGEESEAEDIKGHLIGFDRLMDLLATGEADNGPLILTALWLQRERVRLRAASAPA